MLAEIYRLLWWAIINEMMVFLFTDILFCPGVLNTRMHDLDLVSTPCRQLPLPGVTLMALFSPWLFPCQGVVRLKSGFMHSANYAG